MFMTPEKGSAENWVTAVELAKMVELPVDTVKKKLVILKDAGIVRVKGLNRNTGNLMITVFKEWMKTMMSINFFAVLTM